MSAPLTVGTLDPKAHQGATARIGEREGRLSYARNPSYRRDVRHWYLIIPMSVGPLPEAALSLQWASRDEVEILTPNGAPA